MHPEWWVWIVGGVVLMLAELAVASFFVIWFGLSLIHISEPTRPY